MSRRETIERLLVSLAVLVCVDAQTPRANAETLAWRRVGRPSIHEHLVGPGTGSVSAVWYSADGGTLFAKTSSGGVFQTADFENWTAADVVRPESPAPAIAVRRPEAQAAVVSVPGDARRLWSLGSSLYSSEDGGISWSAVAGAGESLIGHGQRDVAVRPGAPSVLAVANDAGVWQSQDGGQTWAGLNENLPNFPAVRIVSTRRGAIAVALEDGRTATLEDARDSWTSRDSRNPLLADAADRQRWQAALGTEVSANVRVGDWAYAGSSDGRVWVSRDRGTTWSAYGLLARGSAERTAVERFYVDPDAPRAALAAVGSRVFRTVNGGTVWDDISGSLPDFAIHGLAADRASGVAYVATDRGVWSAKVDLNAFVPPSGWQLLSDSLPNAHVIDVALGDGGREIYAALEGYGLYAAPAPVRAGGLRFSNPADFSTRPAAPGSVISVVGGHVTAARAGNLQFPVLAASDGESQLQVPFEARASVIDLAVDARQAQATLPLTIRSVSPAIFVDRDGAPLMVDADSGLSLDAGSAAYPRSRLQFLATGLGRVQPDWPTGVPAPQENPPAVMANVKAYLDGAPVEVLKATLAPGYIGYYLVEVQIPTILNAGPAEFYLSADGQDSNKVRVMVEPESSATPPTF